MAQTGYTPIQLYYSTTAAAAPTAANLLPGELAINITDGKLYYEDNAGVIQTIAYKNVPLSTVTGTLAVANGGTGQTTTQAAINSLAGAVTSGQYLRGNGTNVLMSAIQAGDVPTLNQNTTGTAANVTGIVVIANGGTGATTASAARTNLGASTLGANIFTITNPSAITFPRFNADNTISALSAADFRTAIGAGTGNGSVTSVGGTGSVNGITLSGTVTTSGNLTLGGALSGVSLTTQVAGTLPTANGGTGRNAIGTANQVLGVNSGATGLEYKTITAGTNVTVTHSANSITIAATDTNTTSLPIEDSANVTQFTATQATGLQFAAGTGLSVAFDSGNSRVTFSNTSPSSGGTVTSVGGNGSVNGITLSGTVTSSGNLTLGGSLSGVSLTSQVSGTLPVGNGGTGATTLTGVVIGNGTSAFTAKTNPSGAFVGTTDSQTLTNKTLASVVLNDGYTEEVFTLGTSGSLALNPVNGSIQTSALTGNPTFTDSFSAGQSILLMLTNGSSYTVGWPTTTWVTSSGNAAPTLTAKDVLVFWKVSTTLYGAYVGSFV